MNYKQYRSTIAGLSADKPVYLLEGDKRGCENFFRDRIIVRLKKIIGGEGDPSMMNIDSFYAPDDSARAACDAARSAPFFGGKNLVIIYDADRYREPDQRALEAYLANPNPGSVVVITGKKFDKRKKFYKATTKVAHVISIIPPYERQLPEYVNAYVQSKGKRITPRAVQNLVENVGADLGRLLMEIDKLIIFIGEDPAVDIDHVRDLVGFSREESNFHLCEAVVEQDIDKALKILSVLVQEGARLQEIVSILRWQLERMWRAHDLMKQGAEGTEVGRELGIPPRYVDDFLSAVRRYSADKLQRGYERLLEADWESRNRQIDTTILLDLLMISLCKN